MRLPGKAAPVKQCQLDANWGRTGTSLAMDDEAAPSWELRPGHSRTSEASDGVIHWMSGMELGKVIVPLSAAVQRGLLQAPFRA